MIGIHIKQVQSVINNHSATIKAHQENALNSLKNLSKSKMDVADLNYLNWVITLFEKDDFLTKTPEQIQTLILTAQSVPTTNTTTKTGKIKTKKTGIKDKIIKCLNYKSLRNQFYPEYFQEIGIKSCVYCNSQLTITIVQINGKNSARFDLDHYNSKDDYPFLCISPFNLYPVCASCNRRKSNTRVEFDLYNVNFTNKSLFEFRLDPYSKARYLTTKDKSSIKFKFEEPPITKTNFKTLQQAFHINEQYETQKDIAEELIIKSQIYNDRFKQELRNNFSKLQLNPKLFERFLVGNYIEDREIHKRPMSKFMQDIAKELGLIKKDF